MRNRKKKSDNGNRITLILLNNGYPVAKREEKNSELSFHNVRNFLSPISNEGFVSKEITGVE